MCNWKLSDAQSGKSWNVFENESSFVKAKRKACEIGCKWKVKLSGIAS